MIILEEDDPGTWDRGTPTKKLVHQLSSTRDPVLNVRVPAHRIIGGYTHQGRRHHPALFARRDHRGRLPPHARDRGADDLGQAAIGGRAGDHVCPAAFPRRRRRARHAALRAGPAAKGGRAAPAGGYLGHGRGERFAGLCRRPTIRPTRSAGAEEGRDFRRAEPHRPRGLQGPGQDAAGRAGAVAAFRQAGGRARRAAPRGAASRSAGSVRRCSTRRPTSSAPPASFGTPATAPT